MYQVDKRIHHHRGIRRTILLIVSLLLFGLIIYALFHIRITPKQDIQNSPPVSTNYNATEAAKVAVDKPELKMELPSGWREISYAKSPTAPRYGFKSPSAQAQQLELYIDNPPVNMAVNKVIAVSASDNGIGFDAVSENCTTFTGQASQGKTGGVPAKWRGLDFICDVGNYQRAVVGIISKDGMNQLKITGPAIGEHKFFLTYTDNNNNPDYSIFANILKSIRFK